MRTIKYITIVGDSVEERRNLFYKFNSIGITWQHKIENIYLPIKNNLCLDISNMVLFTSFTISMEYRKKYEVNYFGDYILPFIHVEELFSCIIGGSFDVELFKDKMLKFEEAHKMGLI
jgi:hypothetical protein